MKVYLDVDGVLADFIRSAILAHEMDVDEILAQWPRGEWDAYKVMGLASEGAFWSPIRADDYFWDDIPQYSWARSVVREVQKVDFDFQFATKPSACRNCYQGKSNWIRKLGFEPSQTLNVTPDKSRLCSPGDLLIDDNSDNCEKWTSLGGQVILFPQPWNKNGHISDPLRFLKTELRKIK